MDQLDSDAFERFAIDKVWQSPPREFRDFLYSMPVPATQVAIPAGLPKAWIENLPISGRTRAAVQKAFGAVGADTFLSEPMLARQFLDIRSVGVTLLNELTCVIESAELWSSDEVPTVYTEDAALWQEPVERERLVSSVALRAIDGMSSFHKQWYEFAMWAMAETDAQTFGEAVAEVFSTGAADEVWESTGLSRSCGSGGASPTSIQGAGKLVETNGPTIAIHLHS